MLKHTRITHDRIRQFLEFDLRERLVSNPEPLSTSFCPGVFPNSDAAAKGKWRPIEKGESWGPAYSEGWYRVKGNVDRPGTTILTYGKPEVSFERAPVVEGTIWKDGAAIAGMDFAHNFWRIPTGWSELDLFVQTFAHNKETTVHRPEQPRTAEPEPFEGFLVATLDEDRLALYFDVEFAFNLMQAHEETDPIYMVILRALNDVCNEYQDGSAKRMSKCRRIIKEALDSLNNEIKHTLTAVGHAHLDTAWLWPLSITHLKMAHTTAVQLELAERYPEYVFVHSQASQYEWLEKEHPVLLDRVKKAAKRGQWEPVGSMWVEADCNLTGGESLVRQFLYGRRYFQKHFGTTTHDMWLPDVFGYSAALPQILSKFGIKYFLTQKLSWNQFNKIPSHTFWWVGIDGSRVWSHFPPADTYCSDCTPKQIIESVKKYKDHARCDHSLYLFGFGDGGGGPTEFHVERLKRARYAPGMPLIEPKKRAIDFFEKASEESQDLSEWVGELYFETHRGTYTSQAANKRNNRRSEFLLRDAEWLACFRDDYKTAYPKAELEEAWKLVLLNQFHDIIPGSSVREVYEDSDRDYAKVFEMGEKMVNDSLVRIGNKLDSSKMQRPVAVLHNSVASSEASIPWDEKGTPKSIVCGEESMPVQVVEAFGERRLVFPVPEAALGTVAIADLSDAEAEFQPRIKVSNRKLENHELSIKFDGNGNILSIQSLDDQPTEFVAPGQLANMFQILEDRPLFWDAWDTDIYAQETAKDLVKSESFEIVERGPARAAVEIVKKYGNSTIRQRISLGPTPGIRFDTEVDWQETHKMLKVAFPFNVNTQRASFEIQFGHVERPTHKNTTWDLARFEVCAQKWADMSEGDYGIALLNNGKYGHDVSGNTLRLSLLKSPKAPDPLCDMGVHRFSYVLLPHYGSISQSDVVDCAYAFNAEPRVARLTPTSGSEAELPVFVSCDDPNIVIETVKRAEDSDKRIVRVYECHNSRGIANISTIVPIKRAWLCDLNEERISELDVQDGILAFPYKPFEILTFMLEL